MNLKKNEAESIAGYSAGTLAKFRYAGLLIEGVHYIKPNSRTVRYDKDALEHWAKNRANPEVHHKWLQERAQA